ncbi:hypothetical protein [Caulobacter hibisci]|uniref:Uncharacterized protein n=1 Tax=Caulobacter hibisci TaxID=2035993 RepID=A0ABS0SRX8_9CAUL|nr:hypothetical protein [Caulobacter hibisci]MBI1682385.1 hypothetical protein [Caulobacter hibisci]
MKRSYAFGLIAGLLFVARRSLAFAVAITEPIARAIVEPLATAFVIAFPPAAKIGEAGANTLDVIGEADRQSTETFKVRCFATARTNRLSSVGLRSGAPCSGMAFAA